MAPRPGNNLIRAAGQLDGQRQPIQAVADFGNAGALSFVI